MAKVAMLGLLVVVAIALATGAVYAIWQALQPTDGDILAEKLTTPSVEGARALGAAAHSTIIEVELTPAVSAAWERYLRNDAGALARALGAQSYCQVIVPLKTLELWPVEGGEIEAACASRDAAMEKLRRVEWDNSAAEDEREAAADEVRGAELHLALAEGLLEPYVTADIWIHGSLGTDIYEVSEIIGGFPGGKRYVLLTNTTTFTTTGRTTLTMRSIGERSVTLKNGRTVTWDAFEEADLNQRQRLQADLRDARTTLQQARKRLSNAPDPTSTAPLEAEVTEAKQRVLDAAARLSALQPAPSKDETAAPGEEPTQPAKSAAAPLYTAALGALGQDQEDLARLLLELACDGTISRSDEDHEWLVCSKRAASLEDGTGGLILQRGWVGRADSAAPASAILAIEDPATGFNFRNKMIRAQQRGDGSWSLVEYDAELDVSDCEPLKVGTTRALVCASSTFGGGSSENSVDLVQTDGSVVGLRSWNTTDRVGGNDTRYQGAVAADIAGDGTPEVILKFSSRDNVPMKESDADYADDKDPELWWDSRQFVVAFEITQGVSRPVLVDRKRLDAHGLSAFADPPLDHGLYDDAARYVSDLDPASDAAYAVFRRRIAALHNLQETAALETLADDLLSRFPSKAEQTLRDVLRACFDANDAECMQRIRSDAAERAFDFEAKLFTWRSERGDLESLPRTPHKVPRLWQRSGVPTGELTAREKLRALEFAALEASRDGRHDRAEAFARWLVSSADDDLERLDFLLSLGKVLEAAGEHGRARELYEAMLRVHESDVDVLNRAAWFFLTTKSTRDRDVARGSELARRAASMAPTNPSVLDTHAESKILHGDIEGARVILQRCVVLDPGRPYYAKRLESVSSR